MERNKTCCFTGHREIPENGYKNVVRGTLSAVEMFINEGYDTFICGGAVGFDTVGAKSVLHLKKTYPHIKLVIAIPCREQSKYFTPEQKRDYDMILESADETVCLSERYYRGCMHERNRYMVDNSSAIIVYCTKNSGGSYYTMGYAKRSGLRGIRINDFVSR